MIRSQPGHGTTVDLYLPSTVKPRAEQGERRGEGVSARTTPLDILVVDDDPLVLANTVALLEDLGHVTRTATSGAEALVQLARDPHVDLVLTDHLMPQMTGAQLCRRIRLGAPEMPVLIVSGFAELDASGGGRFPMLAKPFDRDTLARALDAVRSPATVVPLRRDARKRA
jgi:CheY-like chemotaxis protein